MAKQKFKADGGRIRLIRAERKRYYELVETDDYKAFERQIAGNPSDMAPRLVLADWWDEQNMPIVAAEQRRDVRRHFQAIALAERLAEIPLTDALVVTTDLGLGLHEFAQMARDLFRRLGLEGISVIMPSHNGPRPGDNGAVTTRVRFPCPLDGSRRTIWDIASGIEQLLQHAFPNQAPSHDSGYYSHDTGYWTATPLE